MPVKVCQTLSVLFPTHRGASRKYDEKNESDQMRGIFMDEYQG